MTFRPTHETLRKLAGLMRVPPVDDLQLSMADSIADHADAWEQSEREMDDLRNERDQLLAEKSRKE